MSSTMILRCLTAAVALAALGDRTALSVTLGQGGRWRAPGQR
jgi:hypothetical protein